MSLKDKYDSLWELTSDYIMGLDEPTRLSAIKQSPTDELRDIYNAALSREDYEVCMVIKEELESRDVNNH